MHVPCWRNAEFPCELQVWCPYTRSSICRRTRLRSSRIKIGFRQYCAPELPVSLHNFPGQGRTDNRRQLRTVMRSIWNRANKNMHNAQQTMLKFFVDGVNLRLLGWELFHDIKIAGNSVRINSKPLSRESHCRVVMESQPHSYNNNKWCSCYFFPDVNYKSPSRYSSHFSATN